MKKVLLLALLAPVSLWAQTGYKPAQVPVGKDVPVLMKPKTGEVISPARPNQNVYGSGRSNKTSNVNAEQIGSTTYDLQTNGAIARRLLLYPDGRISAVWTWSDVLNATFENRGSNYNHFDGTSWTGAFTTRIEDERTGWPNIVSINEGGTDKEIIVSHFASVVADEDGGFFWSKNNSIGNTNFTTTTIDKPYGALWPRVAASGDYIHIVASHNDDTVYRAGVRRPVVYYRYQISTDTWLNQNEALPGYDSTRYAFGSIDDYSIDVRGNTVAIVMGGSTHDVALWKSTDNGDNWNKTMVHAFAHAPFDPWLDPTFTDTTESNDGSVNVTLDRNNVAHVFYGRMRVLNTNETGVKDSSWSYFPGTNGIVYWNETRPDTLLVIAGMPDMDGSGDLNILRGTVNGQGSSYPAGYGNSISTYPNAAIDANNNIYVVYSAPVEFDEFDDANFRDNFIVYSTDNGVTWSNIQNVTPYFNLEDVFPTVARDADDNLHLMWMQDDLPGTRLINTHSAISVNRIMYRAIPLEDILQNKLGIRNSIKGQNLAAQATGEIFPNPTNTIVTLPLTLQQSALVNVKVIDMMGKETAVNYNSRLTNGTTNVTLNVESLPAGVYFLQVNVNGEIATRKLIKQ